MPYLEYEAKGQRYWGVGTGAGSQLVFTCAYSEEMTFSRAMKDESKFNRPAVGEGILGCGNNPRKAWKLKSIG